GAFPKLVEMERRFGSILRAVIAASRGSEPGRQLFSWPGGIATLPQALAASLGGRIRTGVSVRKINRHRQGFDIATVGDGTHCADAVVLAVQPHVAASLTERLDPEGAEALAGITAPPVGVVFLGYRRGQVAHPLDGLGYLSTRGGDQTISGTQFNSTMFPGRAPEGHVSVSCYVGGARNPGLSGLGEADLAGAVHDELAGLLTIKGDPVVTRFRKWPQGLPHYTLGHAARSATILAAHERVAGLYLTGNYLGGVSVANCLDTARRAAEAVVSAPPLQETRPDRPAATAVAM
ncbi:MAG: protoporphyrinogen oxidase, partial [Rhodobacteraceae bacterium]|nr:protoporphyrinogen oxidase [Paracoccaceae bacterium]